MYRCEYHLVIVSKYRKKIFSKESFNYFKEIVDQKIKDHIPEVEILAMNHDKDHIHIQISIPPKIRISDLVRTIKSISARLLKKRFEYMRKAYWGVDGIWSDGYFVSTIGINDEIIRRYIEKQYQEDVGQAQLSLDLFKKVD